MHRTRKRHSLTAWAPGPRRTAAKTSPAPMPPPMPARMFPLTAGWRSNCPARWWLRDFLKQELSGCARKSMSHPRRRKNFPFPCRLTDSTACIGTASYSNKPPFRTSMAWDPSVEEAHSTSCQKTSRLGKMSSPSGFTNQSARRYSLRIPEVPGPVREVRSSSKASGWPKRNMNFPP